MWDVARMLWQKRGLLRAQVWVELKSNAANTYLGPVWWLLEPLLLMALFYFVIQGVLHRGGENYHLFMLIGLVAWQWFAKTISGTVRVFTNNRTLITQTAFPLISLPVTVLLTHLVYAGFGFVVVIIFIGRAPGLEYIALVPILCVQILFSLALGGLLAIVNVFLPDTQRVIPLLLRCGLLMSPVLYSTGRVMQSDRVPELIKTLYLCNPFVTVIPAYRDVFLDGRFPPMTMLTFWGLGSLVLLACTVKILSLTEKLIPKLV